MSAPAEHWVCKCCGVKVFTATYHGRLPPLEHVDACAYCPRIVTYPTTMATTGWLARSPSITDTALDAPE